ncbi:MAG: flagellin [Schwartzia sp.]|nr:flagellin [Schwartzia sp. (in: firmicutes)]
MAMTVKNNASALSALNQLGRNNSDLKKQLKKVSSGMQINGANDDASGYSISERMRVQIRALSQCSDNTSTGKSMLQIAAGAVDQQIQILGKMREIAMKASDGTYAQVDRDVLQNETTQLAMQLNAISYETNYNDKQLLNGSIYMGEISSSFNSGGGMTDNTVDGVVPMPNGVTDGGGRGITGYGPGQYGALPSIVYDSTQLDPMSSFPSSGQTVLDSTGNTRYSVTTDPSNNNCLSVNIGGNLQPIVIGGQDSNGNPATGFTPYAHPQKSPVNTGDSVLRSATELAANAKTVREDFAGNQIVDGWGSMSDYKLDFSNVTSGGNPITFPAGLNDQGFTIMCAACDQFISVKFDANKPSGTGMYAQDPGNQSEAYMIGIGGAATADDVLAALWDGLQNAAGTTANSGISTLNGGTLETLQLALRHNIAINKYTDASGNVSYYITKDGPEFCFYNGFQGTLEIQGGRKPWQDFFIQGDTRGSQNTRLEFPNTTLDMLFPSEKSEWMIDPTADDIPNPWPDELRTLSTQDRIYYSTKYGCTDDDEIRREKWRDEIWPYPRKGAVVSGSCVRTREKAQKFCEDIDQALKYLLHCGTTLGAQMQRMDAMDGNIVMNEENTQSAESTVRDADMAKEMTGYTKANVLAQSAQSMLAQANQALGGVLDLLQ